MQLVVKNESAMDRRIIQESGIPMKGTTEKSAKLFSLKPIYKYNLIFCLLILLAFAVGGLFQTAGEMKRVSQTTLMAAKTQVEYRVRQSVQLLESLAQKQEYYDASLPPIDKVKSLEDINSHFGYMMICYVDADINVYSLDSAPASLASRDYMQRLFSTGEVQVTDSFAAGADGVTLNYTVAVALYQDGKISGSLFCAIYFEEIQDLLTGAARQDGIEVTLIGSKSQMMSATNTLHYGDSYLTYIGDSLLFQTTKNKIESDFLACKNGGFWSARDMDFYHTAYSSIDDTGWRIVATTDFWSIYGQQLLGYIPAVILFLLFLSLLTWLIKRYIRSQRKTVDTLIDSVQVLEKKLYLDERPDNLDFHEVLQLTSDGLSDGLTGVVTRSVFVNQIHGHLKKLAADRTAALCFIDLDDLKILNDTYGHGAGDIALKSIGYVLREFEKKFDGLVGRYGGDEFVLLLTGLKDFDELHSVLEELIERLRFTLKEFGHGVEIHCSVGVALWRPGMDLDHLLSEADEALYDVKQNEKGKYKIHPDGEPQ